MTHRLRTTPTTQSHRLTVNTGKVSPVIQHRDRNRYNARSRAVTTRILSSPINTPNTIHRKQSNIEMFLEVVNQKNKEKNKKNKESISYSYVYNICSNPFFLYVNKYEIF